MKLEVGKFYKTRDGRKAEVVYINMELQEDSRAYALVEGYGKLSDYDLNGTLCSIFESERDIVSEWRDPERVTGWYNIYADLLGGPYETKVHAINTQCETCIGQIYIDQEVKV